MNDMPSVIYIHGFNSTPNSEKIEGLRGCLHDVNFHAPGHTSRADETYIRLLNFINETMQKEGPDIILCGTSLGGFWAEYFARTYNLKAVIVNPAYNPFNTLLRYIGTDVNSTPWSFKDVDAYYGYVNTLDDLRQKKRGQVVAMIAMDDEILSAKSMIDKYTGKAQVITYPSGGHRFNDFGEICARVRNVINSEVMDAEF